MKPILFVLASLATAAIAQESIPSLPDCGSPCIGDLLTEEAGPGSGCPEGHMVQCLCQKPDVGELLKQCSAPVCDTTEASKVVEYGKKLCEDAGTPIQN